ncbi:MAG: F0F1 ATP synthase subunit delta [Verrucomicrobiales bacterium]|jgi:F-type H+-transporting ATPase subunit delta|nr:F0F1 ATP synthase subunit delta [Verrucomicrobiales bacterium]MEC7357478.1 F0F1 ATP synthase subunit delta [Verrucomicrobiota bacterium]
MKVTKDAARSARQLLRLSHKDGILDHDRIKEITTKVSEAKPRGYLAILQEFGRLVRLDVEQRQAVIETATELGAQAGNAVIEDLRRKYGSTLTAEFKVNPDLLGGMRVKVGSDVWDGSVKARLTELKNKL